MTEVKLYYTVQREMCMRVTDEITAVVDKWAHGRCCLRCIYAKDSKCNSSECCIVTVLEVYEKDTEEELACRIEEECRIRLFKKKVKY